MYHIYTYVYVCICVFVVCVCVCVSQARYLYYQAKLLRLYRISIPISSLRNKFNKVDLKIVLL